MNNLQHHDLYHDSTISRSPPAQQTRSLHRQSSRQFDTFSHPTNGMYGIDDSSARYENPRYGDRINPSGSTAYPASNYEMGLPAWNSSGYGHNNAIAASGATVRVKQPGRGARGGLPQTWLDQSPSIGSSGSFPPYGNMPASSAPALRHDPLGSDQDEDLIPTAIVIKNIPFAVKKEQLVAVMTELHLPLPYAFNYHFDNGVFRGLAFANFTTPDETAAVIHGMNHLDLHGRKLRVEYKKMLPQAERDRIEREKRERRGQLEEQHRPMGPQLQTQSSLTSLSSHVPATSPSPVSSRGTHPNLDLNDPVVLTYFSKLIVFQAHGEQGTDVLTFPASLPPSHRKIIHGLAHQLHLGHRSQGTEENRQVQVYRMPDASGNTSPPATGSTHLEAHRRQLNRSATTDFTNVRNPDPSFYGGGLGTQSTGFLGFSDTQGGLSAGANLRAAKSFADLRSWTPSPAQSTASFPVGLPGHLGRFPDYTQGSPGSSRTNLTPTTTTHPSSNDALLASNMSGMSLGGGFGPSGGSPHRLRGMMSWDREGPAPGPIGGHRTYGANGDDQSRNRNTSTPLRQPRGPVPERGNGFPPGRQSGHRSRGSDELSSPTGTGVEIVVE